MPPVERAPGGTSLIDVLDRVLDKGIVVDAWVRVSLVGIDLITVEARVVVASPPRWNANPEDVRRSVLKLVLTLVELIRQLLERQAVRRMEGGTLSDEEVERVGLALMKLEQKLHELAAQFGLQPSDLNIHLGPLGDLV